jgi:hypothetical protein
MIDDNECGSVEAMIGRETEVLLEKPAPVPLKKKMNSMV